MGKTTHILALRLSAMGDVAMCVPVLSALSAQYPNLRITMLTRAFFEPMFSQLPNITVYPAEVEGRHKGILGLWKLYRELQKQDIDAVADLHNVLRSNILKRYFRWGGVPFHQIDKGRADKKALTAARNKIFKPLQTTHGRYADVFARLGYPLDLDQAPLLSKQTLPGSVLKLVGSDTKKWIGIAPFAAFKGKRYPLDLMQQLIEQLRGYGKYKILLFGGGNREAAQLEALSDSDRCISIAGKLGFGEELTLISNLDLMVSMDSGNGHLAAMYGVPVITLWGVTHPHAGFYPFGQSMDNALLADRESYPLIPTSVYGNKLPKGYERAIASILPEEVLKKIESILEKA